jgi:hypothetical protein
MTEVVRRAGLTLVTCCVASLAAPSAVQARKPAGLALLFTGLDGEWSRSDVRFAAIACATAASDVLVFG